MIHNQSYQTLSLQVPLGVIDENETSYEGMTRILEELQKYVPSKLVDIKEGIPGTNLLQEKAFVDTLVGGDLLSAVRARGAIYIRSGSELLEHRLQGFRIVSEDWHALVCYLEVCHLAIMNVYIATLLTKRGLSWEAKILDLFWHSYALKQVSHRLETLAC